MPVEATEPRVSLDVRQSVLGEQRQCPLGWTHALVLPDGDEQHRIQTAAPLRRAAVKHHIPGTHLRLAHGEVAHVLCNPSQDPFVSRQHCPRSSKKVTPTTSHASPRKLR